MTQCLHEGHTAASCCAPSSNLLELLTCVGAVHVDEPGPVGGLQQRHDGLLQLGPQLQDELVVGVHGEGRRDEAHVQRAAEGHQHVDGAPVVQAHDGVHALRELGADWEEEEEETVTRERIHLKSDQKVTLSLCLFGSV